ncbi:MAG: BACON domain-containing protein, partial [Alloprevotella sp.]
MKNFSFCSMAAMLALLLSSICYSCSDDTLSVIGDVKLPEDTNLMELEMWSYEVPFEVTSNSAWKIESEGDFFYINKTEGTGNATLKICLLENDSEDRQNGEIRLVFPDDKSKNKTIIIQQKCAADYGENAVTVGTGNKIYAVGHGYDATGGYCNVGSVKKQILKFANLVDEGLICYGEVNTDFHERSYYGSSISQISNELSASAGVNGKFCGFKGELTSSFNSSHFSSNNYEYALTYIDYALKNIYVELNLEEMRDRSNMCASAYCAI